MIKLNTLTILLLTILNCNAQIFTVGSSAPLTVQSNTVFYADGLILTPSADITLNNLSLDKNSLITNTSANTSINRAYKFSATSDAFSGTVQINYEDAELNGLTESLLQVNIHDGSSWLAVSSAVNDATNNFVLCNPVSGVTLNELTLAYSLGTLPVQWLSFTAQLQNDNSVMLKWATASEQNSKDFVVQHSTNNSTWQNLGFTAAAGNSSIEQHYSYTHTMPVNGVNYYRILQRDINGKLNYSNVRVVKLSAPSLITIAGNPVVNKMLQVQLNNTAPVVMFLYSSDGKLLLQKNIFPGINRFDMNRYAKGLYWVKAGKQLEKISLQ